MEEVSSRELWMACNTTESRSPIEDIWETQDRVYHREVGQAQKGFWDQLAWAREHVEEWIMQVARLNPQLTLMQAALHVRDKINCWINECHRELWQGIIARQQKLHFDKIKAMLALGLLPKTAFGGRYGGATTQGGKGQSIPIRSPAATQEHVGLPGS